MFARRYAIFVLRDKKGRVLLQHRDMDDEYYPGCWGFFGRKIRGAESPKKVAIREAREEFDIELGNPKFFRRYELPGSKREYHEYFVFVSQLDRPVEKLKSRQRKGSDLGMFSFEDLKTLQFGEHEMVILRDLFGKKYKVGILEVEKKG